jgi:hypothetical protein
MDALCDKVDAFKSLDLFKNKFEVLQTRLTLIAAEITAREKWNEARDSFIKDNKFSLHNEIPQTFDSIEKFLKSVIVPPLFTVSAASARSKHDERRKHRYYPLEIKPWTAFTSIVLKAEIAQLDANNHATGERDFYNVLKGSAIRLGNVKNEQQEESFLDLCLWQPCIKAGLMCDRDEVAKLPGTDHESSIISAVIGLPDSVE